MKTYTQAFFSGGKFLGFFEGRRVFNVEGGPFSEENVINGTHLDSRTDADVEKAKEILNTTHELLGALRDRIEKDPKYKNNYMSFDGELIDKSRHDFYVNLSNENPGKVFFDKNGRYAFNLLDGSEGFEHWKKFHPPADVEQYFPGGVFKNNPPKDFSQVPLHTRNGHEDNSLTSGAFSDLQEGKGYLGGGIEYKKTKTRERADQLVDSIISRTSREEKGIISEVNTMNQELTREGFHFEVPKKENDNSIILILKTPKEGSMGYRIYKDNSGNLQKKFDEKLGVKDEVSVEEKFYFEESHKDQSFFSLSEGYDAIKNDPSAKKQQLREMYDKFTSKYDKFSDEEERILSEITNWLNA